MATLTTTRSRTKCGHSSRADHVLVALGAAVSESEKERLRRVLGARFTVEDLRRLIAEPTVIVLPRCSRQLHERIAAEHPSASLVIIDAPGVGLWDPVIHLVEAGSGRCSTWLGHDGLAEALRSIDTTAPDSYGPNEDH